MTFRINNLKYNVHDLVRKFGYRPLAVTEKGELNCVRPMQGQNYPRFHIYLVEKPDVLTFNIHLDQKKPSYEGSTAHGGDYDGEVVRDEVERIKEVIYWT